MGLKYFKIMDKNELNAQFHKEHQEWQHQLDFYSDQINIFKNELSVIMDRHPDQFSITEHADEYTDIFDKKLNEIAYLRQQLKLHEHEIASGSAPQQDNIWDHESARIRIKEFISGFEQLKKNFRRFVSRQI